MTAVMPVREPGQRGPEGSKDRMIRRSGSLWRFSKVRHRQ